MNAYTCMYARARMRAHTQAQGEGERKREGERRKGRKTIKKMKREKS